MTGAELVAFLLGRGVLEPVDVVDRGVRVVDRRRDRFLLRELSVAGEARLIVKMPLGAAARPYLMTEIAALEYLQRHPKLATMAPQCVASDASLGVLVMQHVAGTPMLAAMDRDRDAESVSLGRLAVLLGALHRESRNGGARVPGHVPWVFQSLGKAGGWRPPALAAVWPLVRDRARLGGACREACRIWAPVCLVHGDVKWEHCLMERRADGEVQLRLIDWELAAMGDPAWDVAGAVAEVILSMAPADGQGDWEASSCNAAALPTARRFVATYLLANRSSGSRKGFARRTSLFTGLRLFQASLELATAAGSASQVEGLVRQCEGLLRELDVFADSLQASGD